MVSQLAKRGLAYLHEGDTSGNPVPPFDYRGVAIPCQSPSAHPPKRPRLAVWRQPVAVGAVSRGAAMRHYSCAGARAAAPSGFDGVAEHRARVLQIGHSNEHVHEAEATPESHIHLRRKFERLVGQLAEWRGELPKQTSPRKRKTEATAAAAGSHPVEVDARRREDGSATRIVDDSARGNQPPQFACGSATGSSSRRAQRRGSQSADHIGNSRTTCLAGKRR